MRTRRMPWMGLPGRRTLPFALRTFRMPSGGLPRNNKRARHAVLLALTVAGLPLALSRATWATAEPSFIYCLNDGGAKVFAGRKEANGSLAFGISVWSPAGQNISVFGIA